MTIQQRLPELTVMTQRKPTVDERSIQRLTETHRIHAMYRCCDGTYECQACDFGLAPLSEAVAHVVANQFIVR